MDLPTPDLDFSAASIEFASGSRTNADASAYSFADQIAELSIANRRQLGIILKKWCDFLEGVGIHRTPDQLRENPTAWGFVTDLLLLDYRQRLLNEAYGRATIRRHFEMLRKLITVAYRAGGICDEQEMHRILAIRSYEGRRGTPLPYPPRPNSIRTAPEHRIPLSPEQAHILKHTHPNSPQGRRDALLMCLLLDHGLHIKALTALKVQGFDLKHGVLYFAFPKGSEPQLLVLSLDTVLALQTYLAAGDVLMPGSLFRVMTKKGRAGRAGMETRHITERVDTLGAQLLGRSHLTPQDCRYFWAMAAVRNGTDV
jgi:integrase